MDPADSRAVAAFQKFLQTRTDHPAPDYAAAVAFLVEYAHELGMPEPRVVDGLVADKPMFQVVVVGTENEAPALLLNSHMDVVTADADAWDHPPFDGVIADGRIYARGTQDMKCVTIQQMEALSRLLARGWTPARSVVLTVVPDEEIGGVDGMAALLSFTVEEAAARAAGEAPGPVTIAGLPIGFALDEGLANPTPGHYTVFNGERAPFFVDVTATGATGHGSRFIEDTAMEKLIGFANKALAFRAEQAAKLHASGSCEGKKLGDVITVNLTILRAGKLHNVIPSEARAGLDIRVPPTVGYDELRALLDDWTATDGLSYTFAYEPPLNSLTETSSSPWYAAFERAVHAAHPDAVCQLEVFPAATDSRYLRALGVPAIGFSPLAGEPILLHDHNESIAVSTFISGIAVYEALLTELTAVPLPAPM
ncbi:aminoacylase-1 [Thecamonas trahens ATCC 50062]|uniref:N-acyl-aliphatic-L-amino acid amidohydrolase n=1 Tax=Thecamonas trahens ATCC 50062 TaxID=461836 RepID=A0A0L0DA53_THETB|nr:aminoacylase-1 [Thecamonas trahens ATCC 50062]KNC48173.1 aminoacylase-1 [Thecamonas trahens ATCC 50062]|eukprot:XP_013758743.1 aminoacylase-1 [Thecamonas trahens ATCC 50062]